jgi:hypothetical protein
MSKVKIQGNASGTGVVTLTAPNTNTDRTITLPDSTGSILDSTSTLDATKLSGALPAIDGSALTGVGSTSGTVIASTSGTSIDFTGLPAGVKKVTFMASSLSTNGVNSLQLQLGTSGGITTSGYLGSYGYSNSTGINLTTGFGIYSDQAADVAHGSIVFDLLDASTNTWTASGSFGWSSRPYRLEAAGSITLSGALTTIRLTTLAGTNTFDSGKVNITYGS